MVEVDDADVGAHLAQRADERGVLFAEVLMQGRAGMKLGMELTTRLSNWLAASSRWIARTDISWLDSELFVPNALATVESYF